MPAEHPLGAPAAEQSRPASRQATVSEFDTETGAGAVLHDNGRREGFAGTAFQAGGLRLLRPGQRVRLDYDGGEVSRVTLITLP